MTWGASELPRRLARSPGTRMCRWFEAQFDGRLRGTMLVALNYIAVDCR